MAYDINSVTNDINRFRFTYDISILMIELTGSHMTFTDRQYTLIDSYMTLTDSHIND